MTIQDILAKRLEEGNTDTAARWLASALESLGAAEDLSRQLPPQARCVGPGPWLQSLEEYYRSDE